MMSVHGKWWSSALLVIVFVGFASMVPAAETAAAAPAVTAAVTPSTGAEPSLVVLIVVDQLRADLLPRYGKYFGEDGFKRLLKRSAYFPNTHLTYGASSTAVGHATIGSGRLPRQHGIVNNEWFLDPAAPKEQHSAYDKDSKVVGLAEGENAPAYSPRYLIGPCLGDQLKLTDSRSRVFSVSLKHRAAIMIAGQNPDGVFWWDRSTGKFVTSTWYSETVPAYIADYNKARITDAYIGKVWDKILPAEAYASCQPVDPSWIPYDYHVGTAFPHKAMKADANAPGEPYDSIYASPFGNEIVLDVAKRILAGEKLGRGPARDMLCVSFSANDVAGHIFGPDSAEVMDMTVRTDRQIAELLTQLDQQVGLDRCVIALTADHGVKELPQVAHRAGMGGGHLNIEQLVKDLNQALATEYGPLADSKPYVLGILPPWMSFSPAFHEIDTDKQVEILQGTAEYLAGIEGIEAVFTAVDLEGPSPFPHDTVWWLAWRSYYPGRSGEIYMHLEPHWYETEQKGTTGHGSAHSQDRHVPILLSAPGIRPGRYLNPADLVDIAPTLAAILGIEPPIDTAGRVLHEAFAAQ
jgi:predicted AlkP superfamily pyrophosphatase or phosphodiesterase